MTQVHKFLAATVGFCFAVGMPVLADTTVHEEESHASSTTSSTPDPLPSTSTTSTSTTTAVGAPSSVKQTTIKTKANTPIGKVKTKTTTTEAAPSAVETTTTKVHTEN
jgi:hypothetical protein